MEGFLNAISYSCSFHLQIMVIIKWISRIGVEREVEGMLQIHLTLLQGLHGPHSETRQSLGGPWNIHKEWIIKFSRRKLREHTPLACSSFRTYNANRVAGSATTAAAAAVGVMGVKAQTLGYDLFIWMVRCYPIHLIHWITIRMRMWTGKELDFFSSLLGGYGMGMGIICDLKFHTLLESWTKFNWQKMLCPGKSQICVNINNAYSPA